MKHKKGVAFEFIVIAIIAIVVCIVIIFAFKGLFGKEASAANDQVEQSGNDCDDDGTMDLFDRCCNTPSDSEAGFDGCSDDKDVRVRCKDKKNTNNEFKSKYQK